MNERTLGRSRGWVLSERASERASTSFYLDRLHLCFPQPPLLSPSVRFWQASERDAGRGWF